MVVRANINCDMFHIKVLEEWCGPLSWEGLTQANSSDSSDYNSGSDDESDDGDGPPLFAVEEEDGRFSNEEVREEEGERLPAFNTVSLIEGKNTNGILNNDVALGEKENINEETCGEVKNNTNGIMNNDVAIGEKENINEDICWGVKNGNDLIDGEVEKSKEDNAHVEVENTATRGEIKSQNADFNGQGVNNVEVEDCGSGVVGENVANMKQAEESGLNSKVGQGLEIRVGHTIVIMLGQKWTLTIKKCILGPAQKMDIEKERKKAANWKNKNVRRRVGIRGGKTM